MSQIQPTSMSVLPTQNKVAELALYLLQPRPAFIDQSQSLNIYCAHGDAFKSAPTKSATNIRNNLTKIMFSR
jgi:hypothetical protein